MNEGFTRWPIEYLFYVYSDCGDYFGGIERFFHGHGGRYIVYQWAGVIGMAGLAFV